MATGRRIKTIAAATAVALAIGGCAGAQYRPVVDTQGVDMTHYNADLADCHAYAATVQPADHAAAGAVAGAIVGTVIGALFGLRGQSLARVAGTGAVAGGAGSGARATQTQVEIVRNCMAGRGYRVLA